MPLWPLLLVWASIVGLAAAVAVYLHERRALRNEFPELFAHRRQMSALDPADRR